MDQRKNGKKAKILFVDDEENILQAIRRLFIDVPFEILTASSGPEGLEILKREQGINIIVSDQRMPGMTGLEFLKLAGEITPRALRMVLTGHEDIEAAADIIRKGETFQYLSKPWDNEALIRIIEEAVSKMQSSGENA